MSQTQRVVIEAADGYYVETRNSSGAVIASEGPFHSVLELPAHDGWSEDLDEEQ